MKSVAAAVLSVLLAACAAEAPVTNLPTGSAAYAVIPAQQPALQAAASADYQIGALDTLDVTVYQEPDLSAKATQVDASGNIALPLVGSVSVKGKSPAQVSRELEQVLGKRYLRDPEVTVAVVTSASQKVAIQGEVTEPGVYPMSGPTTLLDVLSMAKGETDVATLKQVVVFRTVNGQRMGAVFDVSSIRRGQAADPLLQGNDLVVVGYSSARRFWKNVVSAAPLFNIFRPVTGF